MSLHTRIQLTRESGFSLDVELDVPLQGITAVYGDSGTGKTTFLRCLAGLESPARGSYIKLNGVHWLNETVTLATEKRGVGYVFQDARLLPNLSVLANLEFAETLSSRWHSGSDLPTSAQVIQWLGLERFLDQPTTKLSGGQAQRVAIARALLCSHNLLLMDEPVSALDPTARQEILSYLERVHHESQVPIIYVSHNIEEASRLADHLVLMAEGRVAAQGPTLDMCSRIDLPLAHEEDAAAILSGTVTNYDKQFCLTEVDTGAGTLYLARKNSQVGSTLRVRIPARDVSISLREPEQSSILNVLPARILDVDESDEGRVLLQLAHGEQRFLARVTRKSAEELQLRPDLEIYAQIKSVALLNDGHATSINSPSEHTK